MGTVYHDERTGWWVAYFRDAAGQRRRLKAGRTRSDALKTLSVLESEAIRNRHLGVRPLSRVGLADFADRFLLHAKAQIRAWRRYETSVGNLKAFFGNMDLTAITPEAVDKFKLARVEDVEKATVNRDLSCLRRMFNLAIKWNHARENPVRVAGLFSEKMGRVRYLTRGEFERLLDACAEHLRPIVTVAVHTGMRQGEMLTLTWSAVDLENGFASVDDPKNATPRKVPLNETARETLTRLRESTRSVKVFCDADGHPLPSRTLHHQFKKALKKAGIVDFRFHDLRHTCASWLAMAGVPILTIQSVLGHKDIRMTLRYAHLAPQQQVGAVRDLDRFARGRPAERGASSGAV